MHLPLPRHLPLPQVGETLLRLLEHRDDRVGRAAVAELWEQVSTDNLRELSDFEGYMQELLQLFGFEVDGVDYDADVEQEVDIPGLV